MTHYLRVFSTRRIRNALCRTGIATLAAVVAACSDATTAARATRDLGEFVLHASVVGTTVSTLTVTVTARDIASPLVFNIQQQNGTATGTIRVPPGEARLIAVQGFDNTGRLTHEGSKTVDVVPGLNAPLSIAVIALGGQLPITATLGPVSILITPMPSMMIVGETRQLTATVTGPNGDVIAGPVDWATTNPTIARVDQSGLVTIAGPGTAQIVATYAGVATMVQTGVAPLQPTIAYTTWDGSRYTASLVIENGAVLFHHQSIDDPTAVHDDVVLNYVSPGGPGSVDWQARVLRLVSGNYQFQHYRTSGGCSLAAPCFDHADYFIAYEDANGARLVAGIVPVGGTLLFSIRPGS